jgi:hypothetical protein
MTTVNLIRKKISIPDDGLTLQVVWEDQGNPLIDESGTAIKTSDLGSDGQPIPEYPEFVEMVPIPTNINPDQEALEALILTTQPNALSRAQTRADIIDIKAPLIPIIDALNSGV